MNKLIPSTKLLLFLAFCFLGNIYGFAQKVIYVNDNASTGDIFTTAVGNDGNNGLSQSTPVATIASAMSKAVSGDRIMLDAGTYSIPSTIIKAGVKVIGVHRDKSIIHINGGSIAMESDSELWNTTITRIAPATDPPGISIATNTSSSNVRIENCHFSKNRTAIYINPNAQNLVIKGNTFYDNRTGILHPGETVANSTPSTIYIYDNDISNNRSWGIVITDNAVTNAHFFIANNNIIGNLAGAINNDNTAANTKLYLRNNYLGKTNPVTTPISGNKDFTVSIHSENFEFADADFETGAHHPYDICGSNTAAIDASSFHSSEELTRTATTNFVSSSNPVFNFHHTIQDAINSSIAGATLTLPDGVYSEDINVTKQVSLNGASQDGTIILGVYDWQKTANVFNIGAADVSVSNLTISRDYGSTDLAWKNTLKNQGLIVNSHNATIDKVLVKNQRNGIYINNRQNLTLTNSTVSDSRTGLHMVNNVSGATVKNNSFVNNFTHGLMLNVDGNLNISNTNITDNLITGNWFTQFYFHKTTTGGVPVATNAKINCNSFGTNNITVANAAAGEEGYATQITSQFGGAAPSSNYTYNGNQITDHYSLLSLWRSQAADANATEPGFQLEKNYSINSVSAPYTAYNNSYRVLANALGCANNNDVITLNGTFDWTESSAAADWANGMDALASSADDNHRIAVRPDLHGVHLKGNAGTRIIGPGDIPEANLESFLRFNTSGQNKNWKISDLEIEGFDLSIYFGSTTSGGADSLKLYNNKIHVPKDLTDDANQNIGIHLSNGKGVEVYNNTFYIDGTGSGSATAKSMSHAIQSTTSGGTLYDGLKIYNNTITVTGVPDASYPANVIGFWENSQNLGSKIELYNNVFTNEETGNLAEENRQLAFRVTSRSNETGKVKYYNNEISGFNTGIAWLGDDFSTPYTPFAYEANASPVIIENNKFDKVEYGISVNKATTSPNTGSPAIINQNSFTNIGKKAIVYSGNSGVTETSCNWFGTSDLSEIEDLVSAPNGGSISYNLRLENGTSSTGTGFTPTANCIGTVRNVTKGTYHLTIQAAINAADNNDEIVAGAGIFSETLTINKPLTLKGAQAGVDPRPSVSSTRTIGGLDETIITAALNKNVISITADNVVLDGLQVTQSGGSGTDDAIKASNSQTGITIRNNIVHAAADEGIQLEAGKDYLIEKNYILNPKGDGITLSSYNLTPLKGENQKIINNEIKGSESAAGSIYLYGIKEVEIKENLISTKSSGIALGTLTEPTHDINVHHNTILTELRTAYSAAANGIGMDGTGSNITIKNNFIEQVGDFIPALANKDRSNLIRIGISSTSNPTNVIIEENYLARVGNDNYVYVNNGVTNKVQMSCNWLNKTNRSEVFATISGTGVFNLNSYLLSSNNSSTDLGFVPDPDACYGSVHNTTQNTFTFSIQAAIDAANNKDTIVAEAGIYNEVLTINKPLTLKGAQAGVDPRPVVGSTRNTDGTGETVIQGPGNSQLVNITSSNVTFDGFLVKHTTSTGSADLIGSPDATKEGVTIANNILLDATDEGIQIRKTNKALIEKNYVSGSKGDGINVCLNLGGEDQKILDNEIFNSRSDYGSIYLYDVEDVEVKGNYIHGLGQGINVAAADVNGNGGCKNIIIHHNDITSTFTLHPSAAYGIGISGKQTDGITITNNNILNTNTTNTSSSYLRLIDINHTVKNIIISDNYLDAKNRKYIRLFSTVSEKVNASCNWYGTTDYNTILSTLEGTAMLKAYPFLSDGTDSDGAAIGFTPLSGKCTGNVHNKTQNDYYLTIQEAVTSANTGDTLLVSSGTYDEQVLVNKGVVIAKGAGETLPIIKYTGTVTGKPALFDVSVDKVVIDSLYFEVDLSKLKSAVIASGASIDNFTFTNNEIQGIGSPVSGNYSDRNAVSVNHTGNTNYRVASGGVDNIVFSNNVVDGDDVNLGFFRAALAVDQGAVTAEGNILRTINHDILIRFNSKNDIDIKNNVFNGGGVELAEQNALSGKVTIKDNKFNGAGAPDYALLRVKNNQNGIEHEISKNTFSDYKWAISLENMKNVKVDSNTFTTNDASANALVINTKSISSNSSDIVQTTIDATVIDNNFEGEGRGIVFVNHDNRAGTSFGTFTIGQTGKENKFGSDLSNFIAFDSQVGSSLGSTFPTYGGTSGTWLTTMACWSQNINAENNTFDVGSGLKLPASLNATERETLESKLTHKVDLACLGSIQFFNPVKNLTKNTYYTKIQDAVADATAGDTIELSEWTFNENVTIDKTLTIQGVDKEKVILKGTGLAKGSAFRINSGVKNVSIQNLTIENYDGTNPNSTAGIYATLGNDGLDVKKVDIKSNTNMSGFYAGGPVNGISIDSSSFTNHGPQARGIVIWNGLKSNISITNNYLASNACCGIELQDGAATGVLIKGNTVYAEDSGISAVGLTSGSGNAKANIIDSNFVFVKQRFGIEIKNPNGTGNDAMTEDGAIIVSRNTVTHQGAGTLTDLRDLAGIAVHRRGVSSLNVDVPTGVIVKNNEVVNFKQASTSTGFGIVIEGTNHMVANNTLTGNDVGIQQQSGHTPYTSDGNQENVDDLYFGRGNSPIICNITQTGNTFSANGVTERIVIGGAAGTIVTEITPTVNAVASQSVCNGVTIAAVVFAGNNIPGTVYSWTNSEPGIGLAASGTGNLASFTATNTGTDSLKAKIIVTPSLPNGCTGESIEFTIMVNPTPSKPVIQPKESTICEGGSVTLSAPCTVGSILWSTGQTTTSIAVSPTATTKYTAICKDALGCEGLVSDTATVIVLPRPSKPTLTASATTICKGIEVTLTASACTEGTLIWPAGVTAVGNVATVKPTATQTYTVICQQTLMSCQSLPSDVVTITVTETTLTAPAASGNVIISSGASTLLKAECTTGTPKWYSVTGEPLGHGLSYTTPALTVNTDYSVRCVSDVNNENDCKGPVVTQRVTIDKFEIVNQPEHIYVCLGQNAFMNIGVTGRSVAYQWQRYNGTSWDNISNGAVYTGVNTYSLQIAAPGTSLNDSRFRCVVTNTAPDATAPTSINTTAAVLSVYESALANNLTMVSNLSAVTNIYQAVQTIKGTNKISSGSNIKYFAGNSITLEPGFEVSAGNVFTAKVQIPCTNTSSLKEIPEHIEK